MGLIAFFVSIFFSAISICVVMVITALFYNLVSVMGARMHFGMAEYGGNMQNVQSMSSSVQMQSGRLQGGVQIRV